MVLGGRWAFQPKGTEAEVVVGGQGGFQTDPTAGGPQLNQGTAFKASGQLQKLSSRHKVPQMRYPERGGDSGDGEERSLSLSTSPGIHSFAHVGEKCKFFFLKGTIYQTFKC